MSARRFTSSGAHEPWRQPVPPHRREQMHGKVLPMAGEGRDPLGIACLAIAGLIALYFAAQLLRGWLA